MWLATLDGLQRFDGNKFLTFRNQPGNASSVPADVINDIYEDKKGNLWLIADNKIGLFNKDNFTYTEIPVEGNQKINTLYIHHITQDVDGNAVLYISEKGIYTYDPGKRMFIYNHPFDLPGIFGYLGIYHADTSSQYWFSGTKGFYLYDTKTRHINYRGHDIDHDPLLAKLMDEDRVVGVYGQHGDLFWYATWKENEIGAPHFVSFNTKTGEKKKYSINMLFNIGYSEINAVLVQQDGHTWFYGSTFLAELTKEGQVHLISNEFKDEQSIKFNRVPYMYEDRQHNVWVATDNGVFLFNPEAQLFDSYKFLRVNGKGNFANTGTVCALQLKDNRIFIGTWGTGLYIFDSEFKPLPFPPKLEKYLAPYSIWTMAQHSTSGKVWMGMQGGSVLVYDPATGEAGDFNPAPIDGSTIRTLTEDKYGNMWFGMQRGHVVKWDAKAANGDYKKGYKLVKTKDSIFANKIFTDKDGYVWMASAAKGVYKFNPVTNVIEEHYTTSGKPGERLWSNNANDILQYNDSLLLIAGGAINVYNIRTHKISFITSADGLPSNTVNSFIKDVHGTLWLGMAHGLCHANLEKKIFSRYDRRDGISYDNFDAAGAFRLLDGRLVFVTDVNFVVFDPDRFIESPVPANVLITDIKLANNSISVDSIHREGKVNLEYNNTSIAIEFNSLNFVKQNKIHYHYMLEGLEKDWHESNEVNSAIYNFLKPGTYTFKVKAENTDGKSSPAITTLKIHVSPPFWETWWFYGIIALLFAGFLYWMDRERMSRLLALQQVRTQIATNLHKDINTTLGNINLLSEMAKLKADKDLTRSKEYIDQISEKSNNMIIAMDDMLWSLDPGNDNMEMTILRMKEFADAMINRHSAMINLAVDKDVVSLKLDMKSRHEFFLIFKEILHTMMAYTQGEQILVNIHHEKPRLYLDIFDSNKESNQFLLHHNAIQQIKKRAESIKANLEIQSDNKGTAVVLVVPVK